MLGARIFPTPEPFFTYFKMAAKIRQKGMKAVLFNDFNSNGSIL